MKNGMDAGNVNRPPVRDDIGNRKLIRPTLNREMLRSEPANERREAPRPGAPQAGVKPTAPEQTHAENFYYQKQIQTRTAVVVVLKTGEKLQGAIEWYDKRCFRLERQQPVGHLLIYKHSIKYMYTAGEASGNC